MMCLSYLYGFLLPLFLLAAPSLAFGKASHHLEWDPERLEVTVPRGSSELLNVRLHANTDIDDLSFFVVPEIGNFVSVETGRLTSALAGQSYELLIRIAVPNSTLSGIYDGTIHVREGRRTVPAVLKVTLDVIEATGDLNSLVLASDSGGLPDKVHFVIQGDTGSSFRAQWSLESAPEGSNIQLPTETDS